MKLCSTSSCNRKHYCKNYCLAHYQRAIDGRPMEKPIQVIHRKANSHIYGIWNSMIQRCTNPNNNAYNRYGGRGITVCNRWRLFVNFYTDMGDRPSDKHSIDRRDNDKGYSPDNCYWATQKQQMNNYSGNHLITYHGVTRTIQEWSEVKNIKYFTLYRRLIVFKWPISKALELPTNHHRGNRYVTVRNLDKYS